MGKQKSKPQLLKITLTAIWRGETVTEVVSTTRMGVAIPIGGLNRKRMIEALKEQYKKIHERDACLHPGMKLSVKAQANSWEVDYILN